MATLTIRNLDENVKQKIREAAARKGISMEAFVRQLLETAVADVEEPEENIMTLIRQKFAERGIKGIDFDEIPIPPRDEYMTESSVDFADFYPEQADEQR